MRKRSPDEDFRKCRIDPVWDRGPA